MVTSLEVQSKVVVVGRGQVDEFERKTKLAVWTRCNDWTQVLVMKSDHHARVLHHLVEVIV